jgi:glycosyltransferase involved in cell wall biosynthesis
LPGRFSERPFEEDGVRIGLDATPLLGPRTGVGQYVAALMRSLAESGLGDDHRATAFTARGRGDLADALPAGWRAVGPPAPARVLQQLWRRVEWPRVTAFSGPVDVFHATNFVLPPPGRAAGVVTVHDLSFLRSPSTVTPAARAYADLVPRSTRRAEVVLVPSRAVADELVATYDLAEERLVVTPLGVSPEWEAAEPLGPEARDALGIPADYLVFVGNLEPRKNLPVLLDAHRRRLAQDPDAPALVLVGPPGWGPALDVADLPEGKLVLTGYLDAGTVRSVVAGALALVFPSAYEGFGLPPLEAFACGTPVVAADLPVVREVLGTDPTTHRLVAPDDVDGLVDALAGLALEGDEDEAATRAAYDLAVARRA